jgi:hypothetical protein
MNIVNLTPHNVVLQDADGVRTVIASSGVARVACTPGALENVEGVPVPVAGRATYGAVEGLPDPVEGTIYVVSAMVLGRCKDRDDVVGPGTGPKDGAIRNEDGNVIAVTRLVRG